MKHNPLPHHDTEVLAKLCARYGWSWHHSTRKHGNPPGYLICRHNNKRPDYYFVPVSELEEFAREGDFERWAYKGRFAASE